VLLPEKWGIWNKYFNNKPGYYNKAKTILYQLQAKEFNN
jgi:hypothetical protein